MFLVREVYFAEIGFIANGLFWSLTTLSLLTGVLMVWIRQARRNRRKGELSGRMRRRHARVPVPLSRKAHE